MIYSDYDMAGMSTDEHVIARVDVGFLRIAEDEWVELPPELFQRVVDELRARGELTS